MPWHTNATCTRTLAVDSGFQPCMLPRDADSSCTLAFHADVGASIHVSACVRAFVIVEAHRVCYCCFQRWSAGRSHHPIHLRCLQSFFLCYKLECRLEIRQVHLPSPPWHQLSENDISIRRSKIPVEEPAITAQFCKTSTVQFKAASSESPEDYLQRVRV